MNQESTTDENKTLKVNEPDVAKKRDKWDKAQIVGQLLLPLVIALVGISFTYYQSKTAEAKAIADKDVEEKRHKTERVTNLLDHLASDKEKANLLALKVIEYLNQKGEIDSDLVSSITGSLGGSGEKSDKVIESSTETLANVAKQSKSADTQKAAKENLTELTKNEDAKVSLSAIKSLEKVDEQAVINLSARVYLHVLKGTSPERAQLLKKQLEEKGLVVPGIEMVDAVPNQTELRYFVGSDESDLSKINQIMNGLALNANKVDLSSRYPSSRIRPRHYEIWLGKGI
jgi:hypothetical protein